MFVQKHRMFKTYMTKIVILPNAIFRLNMDLNCTFLQNSKCIVFSWLSLLTYVIGVKHHNTCFFQDLITFIVWNIILVKMHYNCITNSIQKHASKRIQYARTRIPLHFCKGTFWYNHQSKSIITTIEIKVGIQLYAIIDKLW